MRNDSLRQNLNLNLSQSQSHSARPQAKTDRQTADRHAGKKGNQVSTPGLTTYINVGGVGVREYTQWSVGWNPIPQAPPPTARDRFILNPHNPLCPSIRQPNLTFLDSPYAP